MREHQPEGTARARENLAPGAEQVVQEEGANGRAHEVVDALLHLFGRERLPAQALMHAIDVDEAAQLREPRENRLAQLPRETRLVWGSGGGWQIRIKGGAAALDVAALGALVALGVAVDGLAALRVAAHGVGTLGVAALGAAAFFKRNSEARNSEGIGCVALHAAEGVPP